MRFDELAERLKVFYEIMKQRGETSNTWPLFALLFNDEIKHMRGSVQNLIAAAGLHKSYPTEIYKGLKLTLYIMLKSDMEAKLRAALEREMQ